MRYLRIYGLLVFLMILTQKSFAQQDILMSQQSFSRINVNPASTGFSNYANAFLLAREQWAGLQGAPSTQLLNLQAFVEEIRSGLGLTVMYDRIGHNKTFNIKLSYAYHFQVGEEKYISLGINGGLLHKRFGGDIIFEDPETDPEIVDMATNGKSVIRPDFDFGLAFSAPAFTIGLSATHISRYLYKKEDWFKTPLHAYLYMDFNIRASENFMIIPRLQAMTSISNFKGDTLLFSQRISYQFEAGITFSLKNKFWIGATYRHGDALVGMVGFNFTPNLRFGYSYDFRLGNSFKGLPHYGSHEIMLNYRLKIMEEEESEFTPRFFD